MKHAIKACWTTSLQLLLAWIGLCATPGLAQPTDTDGAEHLVRALILEKPGAGFSAPPARIDLDTLPTTWSEVDLPIAPVPTMLVNQRQVGELLYQSRANLQWNGSNLPLWLALDELPSNTRLTEIAIRIQHLHDTGITLLWEVADVPALDWLDPKSALHILRILQEALTNAIKHANATEIRVATAAQGEHVRVTIADNGQGFAANSTQRLPGKGLANQTRRAEAIGATFN